MDADGIAWEARRSRMRIYSWGWLKMLIFWVMARRWETNGEKGEQLGPDRTKFYVEVDDSPPEVHLAEWEPSRDAPSPPSRGSTSTAGCLQLNIKKHYWLSGSPQRQLRLK